MTSDREEMLKRQLADANAAVLRYTELVDGIREWASIGEAGSSYIKPAERLSRIRRLLKEADER